MASISDVVTIAAGTSNSNVIADSKFVQPPFPAAITVHAVQAGADAGTVHADFSMGNSIEADNVVIQDYTAGQGPLLDGKHRIASGVAAMHDRLQFKVKNDDAVNDAVLRYFIDIKRLA